MSKQLTLSASAAIAAMTAFALVASLGGLKSERAEQLAGNAPLIGVAITR